MPWLSILLSVLMPLLSALIQWLLGLTPSALTMEEKGQLASLLGQFHIVERRCSDLGVVAVNEKG